MIAELARRYRRPLTVIFVAMIVETLAGLAGPWPLKVVIDNIAASDRRSDWPTIAVLAAAAVVVIALVRGLASYVDNYYTESVGQRVANDLRMRVYDHLECLSFSYYDTHQTGELLSTITDDVATVQDFISSSTLSIVIDTMTIVGMLALMFWLNWRFSLFVLLITPILLLFINRFRKAVKRATREVRRRESDVVTVIQSGIESIRTVQAFDAREVEVARLGEVSRATVEAALNARRVKSLLSPSIDVVVAVCTAIVLWRGAALMVAGAMTVGALVVFLSYLAKFFKPVQDLAKMTNAIAQTNVALERITSILSIEVNVQEWADAREPEVFTGAIAFEHVAFSYSPDAWVLRDVSFDVKPGQFVGVVGPTGSGKSTIAGLIPRFTIRRPVAF